jgi:DNA topoisomerase-1
MPTARVHIMRRKIDPHRRKLVTLPLDPVASARVSGLRYVSDATPGIRRKRAGRGFCYVSPEGTTLRDRRAVQRIRSLVIPPAWTDVWICASEDGHLQAVGRDARGRKQYRYHKLYRQVRDQTKFSRMAAFAEVLPAIRARVEEDLKLPGLPKAKVMATLVKLLEATCIRIGNEEYVQQNESFGLTTLRGKHVQIGEKTLRFRFKGKSGQTQDICLTDRKLAKIVHDCQALPGQELFQYLDEDGNPSAVRSEDVNGYIREIAGQDFTAKDYRTWMGTVSAFAALEKFGLPTSATDAKKEICEAIKGVAHKLGNRPATCRAYYVHPAILESYSDGSLFEIAKSCTPKSTSAVKLSREENCALAVINAASKHGIPIDAKVVAS